MSIGCAAQSVQLSGQGGGWHAGMVGWVVRVGRASDSVGVLRLQPERPPAQKGGVEFLCNPPQSVGRDLLMKFEPQ